MFKKFTNGCVRVVNRWLPDAFLFAIILTLIVFVAAMCATGMGPVEVIAKWGDAKGGFWNLLAFSMQMALVLVLALLIGAYMVTLSDVSYWQTKAENPGTHAAASSITYDYDMQKAVVWYK